MYYVPDNWVLVTIKTEDTSVTKVFAGWFGGFAAGDSWKLSSGVVDVVDHTDHLEYKNHSGSVYLCRKNCYGMSAYMRSILNYLQNTSDLEIELLTNNLEIELHDKF